MPKKSDYRDAAIISSVDRALRVMETIRYEDREMGINEIASIMGEYPSTIYRVISTMMSRGYLYQNPDNSKYGLSYKVFLLAKNLEKNSSLIRIARPFAEELAAEFKESVNIAVRDESRKDGYYAITIFQARGGNRTLGISEAAGRSYRCYYSSVGKALLAFSDDLDYEVIRRTTIDKYTDYTITDSEQMIAELEKIRKSGISIDNQEQEMGLFCVGCPVLNRKGNAVMAISISGYEGNINNIGVEKLSKRLREVCAEMSKLVD